MRALPIPGYKELFKEPGATYNDLLKQTSSDTILMLLISINLELNAKESFSENQQRLFNAITYRFSPEQMEYLKNAVIEYKKIVEERTGSTYEGEIFGRRYLLQMILKELERNNKEEADQDAPIHEYNFFVSYLLTVDEVSKGDYELLDVAKRYKLELMPWMPLIWAPNIRQYEFNDFADPGFELFKLLSFSKYALENYRSYFKELINGHGFESISQFISSFYQIIKASNSYQPNELLKKLYFIIPDERQSVNHLESMCINNHVAKELAIDDLRRYPLYKTQKRGYMVIDENMYMKKVYRGPLFELHKETSLLNEIKFEDYKTGVSKDCFENILFKGIVSQMINDDNAIVHFDTNSKTGEPDLYIRYKNDIFLIEFKDYLFPESILKSNNFGAFRKYIDGRFLLSDGNKKKGVTQLASCIGNLLNRKYSFDPIINEKLEKGEHLDIYPIICHTDFMFSMPGLNEYLRLLFNNDVNIKGSMYSGIHSMTLINLEVLFDLSLRGKGFAVLLNVLNKYYQFIGSKRRKYQSAHLMNDFVSSTASFDEFYKTKYRSEMIDNNQLTDKYKTKRMRDIVGISQEEMDLIL